MYVINCSNPQLTKVLADFLFGLYLLNYVLKPRDKPYTTTLPFIQIALNERK